MTRITIEDLPVNETLDNNSALGVVGGWAPSNALFILPTSPSWLGGPAAFNSSSVATFEFGNNYTFSTQASQFSDRRLKTDIERIGETAEGYPKYRFRYLWNSKSQIGVMADEVPNNLVRYHASGFAMVDYSRITL